MVKLVIDGIGGGIFSKFMTSVQFAEWVNREKASIDGLYFHTNIDGNNVYDFVLEQLYNDDYMYSNSLFIKSYSASYPIEESREYTGLRAIVRLLQLKPKLVDLVDSWTNDLGINENTIGVHIRLCDMNITHGVDFGIASYELYESLIDKALEVNPTANLFIASDNDESIEKLRSRYGSKIKYVPGLVRGKTETEHTGFLQEHHIKSEQFWLEAFLDMLLLSKCSQLICRTSNVINAALLFSNTITTVTRIDETQLIHKNASFEKPNIK